MTPPMTQRSLPFALMISTVGTILVTVAAVWLATSLAYGPVATPDPSVHSKSYKPSDRPLYRLSPIPPGADWTS